MDDDDELLPNMAQIFLEALINSHALPAPVALLLLIQGSVNAMGFEQRLEQWLCQELHPSSTLILDNAPIHRKNRIQEIAEIRGHQVLFLPRYSPDVNSIEHDFAAIKKRRKYATKGTSIA